MNYNTVYVGMDVHKESFTFCAYTIDAEKGSYFRRTEADYKNVLKYLEFLRTVYGNDANFICGYEAGCLGYTLCNLRRPAVDDAFSSGRPAAQNSRIPHLNLSVNGKG